MPARARKAQVVMLTIVLTAAFLILLGVAAVVATALAAVHGIDVSKVRILAGEKFAGSENLARLLSSEGATAPLTVLCTLCNLGAALSGVGAVVAAWGGTAAWIGAPIAILAVIMVGELAPRAIASRNPVRLALAAAPILSRGSTIFGRALFPILALGRIFARPSASDASRDEQQVREALEIGVDEGLVEVDEHRLVERAFKLDELNAWDAMTPRVDIVALKDSSVLGDILHELEGFPHSRVPVFGTSIDDVTGILHVRDAYRAYVAGDHNMKLSELSREAMFVPGSISLSKLIAEFRARRTHMGIVADEFGGTDGLITLEDVLEELVGEIVDETDVDEDLVTRISPDEIMASGGAELRDINDRFGFELPAGDNRSLNGFILEEFGRVPERGMSLDAGQAHIEVVQASDTRVLRVRLRRSKPEPS